MNGCFIFGSGCGGISLDDFFFSFLKIVEVVKFLILEMIEGVLGGIINMIMVRFLELFEFLVVIIFDGEYVDKVENWVFMFIGVVGINWDLGDVGIFGVFVVMFY